MVFPEEEGPERARVRMRFGEGEGEGGIRGWGIWGDGCLGEVDVWFVTALQD